MHSKIEFVTKITCVRYQTRMIVVYIDFTVHNLHIDRVHISKMATSGVSSMLLVLMTGCVFILCLAPVFRCETEINECAHDPCQNNATCIDQVAKFECNCTTNYTESTVSDWWVTLLFSFVIWRISSYCHLLFYAFIVFWGLKATVLQHSSF